MTYRNTALAAARDLAQQIWEESFSPGHQAYYVQRDGSLARHEYVGNSFELQSVYFEEEDHPERLADTGLGSVSYNGDEEDYREMVPFAPADNFPPGRWHGDFIGRYGDQQAKFGLTDEQQSVVEKTEQGLYWIMGYGWCRPGEICRWHDRDVEDPSTPLVDVIEALPDGWFADEVRTAA